MQTDKPLISIVMAVYEPRMDWLAEQLLSLNAQTYPNLELNVLDDCSPTVSFEEIRACVERCITAFPYTLERNEQNLGSNLTFERLTMAARGEYIAYCDQDDRWYPEKVFNSYRKLVEEDALLVCSDVTVMDELARPLADSITRIRTRHCFLEGEGLALVLLYRNFVIGCTILINASTAKSAIPFAVHMVHDHYLALYCASLGRISVCNKAQMAYRLHPNNQTGVLHGINTKQEYYDLNLHPFTLRIEELAERAIAFDGIQQALLWSRAREQNYFGRWSGWFELLKLRKLNPAVTWFELMALKLPDAIFRRVTAIIRKKGF